MTKRAIKHGEDTADTPDVGDSANTDSAASTEDTELGTSGEGWAVSGKTDRSYKLQVAKINRWAFMTTRFQKVQDSTSTMSARYKQGSLRFKKGAHTRQLLERWKSLSSPKFISVQKWIAPNTDLLFVPNDVEDMKRLLEEGAPYGALLRILACPLGGGRQHTMMDSRRFHKGAKIEDLERELYTAALTTLSVGTVKLTNERSYVESLPSIPRGRVSEASSWQTPSAQVFTISKDFAYDLIQKSNDPLGSFHLFKGALTDTKAATDDASIIDTEEHVSLLQEALVLCSAAMCRQGMLEDKQNWGKLQQAITSVSSLVESSDVWRLILHHVVLGDVLGTSDVEMVGEEASEPLDDSTLLQTHSRLSQLLGESVCGPELLAGTKPAKSSTWSAHKRSKHNGDFDMKCQCTKRILASWKRSVGPEDSVWHSTVTRVSHILRVQALKAGKSEDQISSLLALTIDGFEQPGSRRPDTGYANTKHSQSQTQESEEDAALRRDILARMDGIVNRIFKK